MTEEKKQEAIDLIKGRVEEAHKNKYKDVTGIVYIDTLLDLYNKLNLQQTN
jgi:hypothetical protein